MSTSSFTTAEGNVLRPPGYSQYDLFRPREIMASTARFTQKGVTIGAGQGVIYAGHCMGRRTANKKYYKYNNNNADGTDTAKGILRESADTGTAAAGNSRDLLGNIVMSGILKNSMLSGVDSNAITDLNARVDSDRDWFIF
jgi:hypothetical protein